MDLNVITQTLH